MNAAIVIVVLLLVVVLCVGFGRRRIARRLTRRTGTWVGKSTP